MVAAQAATQIFELLLTDGSLRDGLIGMPHYAHTMIAFASGFLLQLTAKYNNTFVDQSSVHALISRLVEQLRSMPTSDWHLVRLLVEGLEKMIKASLRAANQPQRSIGGFMAPAAPMNNGQIHGTSGMGTLDFMPQPGDYGMGPPDAFTMPDFGLSSSFLPFNNVNQIFETSDLGYL